MRRPRRGEAAGLADVVVVVVAAVAVAVVAAERCSTSCARA